MPAFYTVRGLDGKRVCEPVGYATKKEAKIERNRLTATGTVCVVSRGRDHPHGPTRPDPICLNRERTSFKRKRRKISESEA